jgi:hypothetical protein
MPKIVAIDNFDRDYRPDRLVAENITSEAEAQVMVDALNERYGGDHVPDYYVVKSDDYKLKVWEEY